MFSDFMGPEAYNADKRLPDCEGIETRTAHSLAAQYRRPTRGCPTVRVLRLEVP